MHLSQDLVALKRYEWILNKQGTHFECKSCGANFSAIYDPETRKMRPALNRHHKHNCSYAKSIIKVGG